MNSEKLTVDYFQARIEECLRAAGRYTQALDLNIWMLAGALVSYAMALRDITALDSVTITEETQRGSHTKAHPAFKICRDAEENCRKQLKELGLNSEGTRNQTEADPLADLVSELHRDLRGGKTIRPK